MRQSALRDVIRTVVGVGVAAIVLHVWFLMGLVVPVTVAGSSMEPSLVEGRRMLVDRTAFELREPRRWEVVVLRSPDDASQLCVKRVVGLPGETVSLRGGDVWIDGQPVAHPLGLAYDQRYGDRHECRLGPREYFLLGDNGEVSDDSRSWRTGGAVDAKLFIGRPLGVR